MEKKLTKLFGKEVVRLEKLFGEASYRTYYRGFFENNETFVLMAIPAGKMSVSEEITNLKEKLAEPSFINVGRYLQQLKFPVPKIGKFIESEGWIILEDLGDTKLADVVAHAASQEKIEWYKRAIDLLISLQSKTSTHSCIAFHRSFDATLFNWEFDHFWEYYVSDQRSAISSQQRQKDQKLFEKETRKITAKLCKLPQGFTHRDYQSRNLMIKNNQLYIIDFQDALLGPTVYDLVALLRDSYVDLTPHIETLLRYYCEKKGENFETLQHAFDLQTVQRKLKDSGRFIFIDRVKKNPNFLPFLPTSLSYVKQALERLPEHKNLLDLLQKYVKEWS